jgi:hypothetical protein
MYSEFLLVNFWLESNLSDNCFKFIFFKIILWSIKSYIDFFFLSLILFPSFAGNQTKGFTMPYIYFTTELHTWCRFMVLFVFLYSKDSVCCSLNLMAFMIFSSSIKGLKPLENDIPVVCITFIYLSLEFIYWIVK